MSLLALFVLWGGARAGGWVWLSFNGKSIRKNFEFVQLLKTNNS